jgi:hypothetical protein
VVVLCAQKRSRTVCSSAQVHASVLGVVLALSLCFFIANHDAFLVGKRMHGPALGSVVAPAILRIAMDDPGRAINTYKARLKEHPSLLDGCHGFAHKIGHTVYERFGIQQALAVQDPFCVYGYVHGVLESHFGERNGVYTHAEVVSVCGRSNACYHGIGHALMLSTRTVEDATHFCARFLQVRQRSNCADGVFMHIFDQEDTGIAHEQFVPKGMSMVTFCMRQPPAQRQNCALYLPRSLGADPLDVVKNCRMFSDEKLQSFCVIGAGIAYAKYHLSDPALVDSYCARVGQAVVEFGTSCRAGADRYRTYQNESADAVPW